MPKFSENLETYAIEVIMGKRRDLQATLLRGLLWMLSGLYRGIVQTRLFLYKKRVLHDRPLGCMVISIGNLTVGGTGKTPVVEKFARALTDHGRRVAILSRGYKSKKKKLTLREKLERIRDGKSHLVEPPRVVCDGKEIKLNSLRAGDEPYMLAQNLGDVAVIVDKDRVKSGLWAVKNLRVDTLLLDDGLQYLRLGHRLDIVLIDTQEPFGNGFLLPRGTLREPPANIRRASYIFLTKSKSDNGKLIKQIRKWNRTAEIIECRHRPMYFQNLYSGEKFDLDMIKGHYVGAMCGIAQPSSFYNGLRALGANVEITKSFADHHRFTRKELKAFTERCIQRDLKWIMTTQKDAVRFPTFNSAPKVPIFFMRVDIEILSGHETFEQCVQRICQPPPNVRPRGRSFSEYATRI